MKNSNTMVSEDHLSKSTREFMDSCDGSNSNEERIRLIQSGSWIGYNTATSIIERIDDMIKRPRVTRMHSLLVIGGTDNGKTTIRKRIEKGNERYASENGKMHFPVVSVQMPSNPDERSFFNVVLRGMMQPPYINGKVDHIKNHVIDSMEDLNVRLLMIDEVQHIDRIPYKKQRTMLDTIKYMSNELSLPIVAFGTEEAINVFAADPQLSNRFKKIFLPRWDANSDFIRLLASLESMLPLKEPSMLRDSDIASHIFKKTNGTIGEVSTLIRDAAVLAIKSGKEKITISIIDDLNFDSSKSEPI